MYGPTIPPPRFLEETKREIGGEADWPSPFSTLVDPPVLVRVEYCVECDSFACTIGWLLVEFRDGRSMVEIADPAVEWPCVLASRNADGVYVQEARGDCPFMIFDQL
jgi:hypothetical protein